jgi:hypothetical protein
VVPADVVDEDRQLSEEAGRLDQERAAVEACSSARFWLKATRERSSAAE